MKRRQILGVTVIAGTIVLLAPLGGMPAKALWASTVTTDVNQEFFRADFSLSVEAQNVKESSHNGDPISVAITPLIRSNMGESTTRRIPINLAGTIPSDTELSVMVSSSTTNDDEGVAGASHKLITKACDDVIAGDSHALPIKSQVFSLDPVTPKALGAVNDVRTQWCLEISVPPQPLYSYSSTATVIGTGTQGNLTASDEWHVQVGDTVEVSAEVNLSFFPSIIRPTAQIGGMGSANSGEENIAHQRQSDRRW